MGNDISKVRKALSIVVHTFLCPVDIFVLRLDSDHVTTDTSFIVLFPRFVKEISIKQRSKVNGMAENRCDKQLNCNPRSTVGCSMSFIRSNAFQIFFFHSHSSMFFCYLLKCRNRWHVHRYAVNVFLPLFVKKMSRNIRTTIVVSCTVYRKCLSRQQNTMICEKCIQICFLIHFNQINRIVLISLSLSTDETSS